MGSDDIIPNFAGSDGDKKKFDAHNLKDYKKLAHGSEVGKVTTIENRRSIDTSEWEITSVNVYTIDGLPIFSSNYGSKLSTFDSNIILQFYTTVQTFAKSNLNSSLIDFKVGDERVYFRADDLHGHIYLITVNLGTFAKSGRNSAIYVTISSLITDISSLLIFHETDQNFETNFDFSLKEAIDEMVNEVNNQDLIERENEKVEDLEISFSLITDTTGIPIFSKAYGGKTFKDEDPILITMFLHALNVFFNTNFSDELREINFGSSRLYIKNIDDYFYAIFVQFTDDVDLRENSKIHTLSHNLLDQMSSMVNDLGVDIIEDISNDNLQLMIDNIIFKGMFNLNEELSKM